MDRLRAHLLGGAHHRGVGAMNQSDAELLLAVQLEQAGIPFRREFQFAASMGRKWRADFEVHEPYPGAKCRELLVEIDGGGFITGRHSRGTGVEKDCEKQSAAAILGYRVVRVTPRQVENGLALSWIRQALGLEDRSDAA